MADTTEAETRRHRGRAILDTVATVLMALAALLLIVSMARGVLTARARPENAVDGVIPKTPVSLEGAARLGNPSARAVLIEYSDFQCPFCARFVRDAMPKIREKYIDPGRVQLAFRHFPLKVHVNAFAAAAAAVCANYQGQFWPMHEKLFGAKELDVASTGRYADELGLDAKQFRLCLNRQGPSGVEADMASARAVGITSTPTFLIGTIGDGELVTIVARAQGAAAGAKIAEVLDGLVR